MLGRLLPNLGRAPFADPSLRVNERVIGMVVGNGMDVAPLGPRADPADREHAGLQRRRMNGRYHSWDVEMALEVR